MPPQRIQLAEWRERHNSPSFLLQLVNLMIAHLRVGYFVLYCFNACTKGISTFLSSWQKTVCTIEELRHFLLLLYCVNACVKRYFHFFLPTHTVSHRNSLQMHSILPKNCIFSFLLGCVAQKVFSTFVSWKAQVIQLAECAQWDADLPKCFIQNYKPPHQTVKSFMCHWKSSRPNQIVKCCSYWLLPGPSCARLLIAPLTTPCPPPLFHHHHHPHPYILKEKKVCKVCFSVLG